MITPGPWMVRDWRNNRGAYVITNYPNDDGSILIVCEVNRQDNPNAPDNARLIAASPDLFAVCKELLSVLEEIEFLHPDALPPRAIDIMQSVSYIFAKVEGE